MKKCMIVSDSFKGTLSSSEICQIAAERLDYYFPGCKIIRIPVADGGEGTVACFHEACGGQLVSVTVSGPYGEPVTAEYLQLPDGQAVIEMAAVAGLPQVENRKNPCKTTTYGVGQMIRHAIEHGNQKILLGLGGSCTNDGGCGCAAALGARFSRADGSSFIPVGEDLDQIAEIDLKEVTKRLQGVSITVMCDIDNPLYGPSGAAYVFAPQKGADEEMVRFLDRQLIALSRTIETRLGISVASIPGAGAAGGFGAGTIAFLGAKLQPGIETVLEIVNFDTQLQGCDMVFTGEGRLDSQSMHGKVISGVTKHAKMRNVPVVAVVGSVMPDVEDLCDDPSIGLSAVFSVNRQAMDFEQSRDFSRENYTYTFNSVLRLIRAAQSKS